MRIAKQQRDWLPVKVGSNAVPSVGSKKIGGAEHCGAPLQSSRNSAVNQDWNCVGGSDSILVLKENCGLCL